MIDTKEIWIRTGYESFAVAELNGLRIEPLAKKVGISKSSFYHHFADLDIFIEHLLRYHIQQAYLIAEKERNAQNISPDLIEILVEHKIDLLFNRQLRINRNNKHFHETLVKANDIVGNSFVFVWVKDLNLNLSPKQLEAVFQLALENFYLQINSDNLTHQWLTEYFLNLKSIVTNLV
jgi:AcrR family transcriptional regulator